VALDRRVVINCADRVARKNAKRKESLLSCLELKLARLLYDFHQKPVGMEMEFDICNRDIICMHHDVFIFYMQRMYGQTDRFNGLFFKTVWVSQHQ